MGKILETLHEKELHFRLEDDEEGYYLSIIDRKKYPRVRVDNMAEGVEMIIRNCLSGQKLA